MNIFSRIYYRIKVDVREKLNPYLSAFRKNKLIKYKGNLNTTIISNNCWGAHVYRYFGLKYNTPTIGLFFFAHDYIKFVSNLKEYLSKDLVFITHDHSNYKSVLDEYGGKCANCPIAKCGDIEIIFMHYKSNEEALEKWTRRIERINWDNLIIKFSEMNGCSISDLEAFDKLPYDKKFVFVTKDYGLTSQIIFKQFQNQEKIGNDTDNFRNYINLYDLFSSKYFPKVSK